jgi:hypothetical protein
VRDEEMDIQKVRNKYGKTNTISEKKMNTICEEWRG